MSSANISMHIVCPNCTTSYAVNPASFGAAGRTVRCARCKEVWLAQPEDLARTEVLVPAMAAAPPQEEDMSAWGLSDEEAEAHQEQDAPTVESPPIAGSWPAEDRDDDWAAQARREHEFAEAGRASRFGSRFAPRLGWLRRLTPAVPRIRYLPRINLATGCAAMAALVLALMVWRVDVVRLMPQTAGFYRTVGLNVNLRALAFKDVKVTTETVDGKPVLVIEGMIVGEGRKPVELPRLRFIVRDGQGSEIYAWNAVLEQPVLNPGEKAWFRSRLASPPADGRNLDVRFFNKRDIGA
jgi:predicted Zn finger-like uncharacterized protein